MKPTWDAMAAGIAMQPVPPDLCRVVHISCNDCEQSQENRAWHFLGLFAIVVDTIVCSGREAHDFLEKNGDGKKVGEAPREGPEGAQLSRSGSSRRVVGRRRSVM